MGLKLNEWEWTKRCGGVRWAPCELVALLEEGEKNEKFLAWGEGLDPNRAGDTGGKAFGER